MKKEIDRLTEVCMRAKRFPKNLRLFLITKDRYIRLLNGKAEVFMSSEFGVARHMRFERGYILDFFSKLEFFINELIRLKLIGFDSERDFMLDDILENVDLFSRIRLLEKWNVIDGSLTNELMQAKNVRNGFAHVWDKNEVKYRGGSLKDKFPEFTEDMVSIWKKLILVYDEEQKKIDVSNIVEQIKKLNPNM
ncbi:MAG: hypothetical protein WBA22_09660 [Candidatus Methanofastidiosia archaeon]